MSSIGNRERRSFRPHQVAKRHNVSRAFIYEEIRRRRLKAYKAGNATLIRDDDEAEWLAQLPQLQLGADEKATG
jgi:excisionase family DNA binding protein